MAFLHGGMGKPGAMCAVYTAVFKGTLALLFAVHFYLTVHFTSVLFCGSAMCDVYTAVFKGTLALIFVLHF